MGSVRKKGLTNKLWTYRVVELRLTRTDGSADETHRGKCQERCVPRMAWIYSLELCPEMRIQEEMVHGDDSGYGGESYTPDSGRLLLARVIREANQSRDGKQRDADHERLES